MTEYSNDSGRAVGGGGGGCATHGGKINNEKTGLPDGALVFGFWTKKNKIKNGPKGESYNKG